MAEVLAGQLDSCEDQLYTKDKPGEVQRNAAEVFFRLQGIVERSYPIQGMGREDDAEHKCDHCSRQRPCLLLRDGVAASCLILQASER